MEMAQESKILISVEPNLIARSYDTKDHIDDLMYKFFLLLHNYRSVLTEKEIKVALEKIKVINGEYGNVY